MELTPVEARVLAVLVEKEATTPAQYPLSEHAVVAGCNQSTNRDPVTALAADEVRIALRGLREQGLARTVHRPGERAEKHRHLLVEALGLDAGALAVLAVLVLRGPQTPAELRARTERLHAFTDTAAVESALAVLAGPSAGAADPGHDAVDAAQREGGALARRLDRVPGEKAARWTDLIHDPREPRAASSRPADATTCEAAATARTPLALLAEQVAELRAEVAALRAEVAALRGGDRTPR